MQAKNPHGRIMGGDPQSHSDDPVNMAAMMTANSTMRADVPQGEIRAVSDETLVKAREVLTAAADREMRELVVRHCDAVKIGDDETVVDAVAPIDTSFEVLGGEANVKIRGLFRADQRTVVNAPNERLTGIWMLGNPASRVTLRVVGPAVGK